MPANVGQHFDPVQKCCANWPTRSNMYQTLRQHLPTLAQHVEQTFPTLLAQLVGECW